MNTNLLNHSIDNLTENIFIKKNINSFLDIQKELINLLEQTQKENYRFFKLTSWTFIPFFNLFIFYNIYSYLYSLGIKGILLIPFISLLTIFFGFVGTMTITFVMFTLFDSKKSKLFKQQEKMLIQKLQQILENKETQIEVINYLDNLENKQILKQDKDFIIHLKNNIILLLSEKNYIKTQQLLCEKKLMLKDIEERTEKNIDKELVIKNYLSELNMSQSNAVNLSEEKKLDNNVIFDYRKLV